MMDELNLLLRGYVTDGIVPGITAAIAFANGETYTASAGTADLNGILPVTADTQMRVYSLTKPLIACSVLQLAECGLIDLNAPVYEYLPVFRQLKLRDSDIPVADACTVLTLLQMTSGIVPFFRSDSREVKQLRTEIIDMERPFSTVGLAEWIASIPLAFYPGRGFVYGMSYEVLAALIEKVSGQRLSEYLKQHIFKPLGMKNTAFYITRPEQRADILKKAETGFRIADEARYRPVMVPPGIEWGGDGLYSTAGDYIKFLQDQAFDHHVFSADLLRQMITPERTYQCRDYFESVPLLSGCGYGMGVRVVLSCGSVSGEKAKGEYGWYGHTGGWSMSNIAHGVTAVVLTQCLPSQHMAIVPEFARIVYRFADRMGGHKV